MADGQNSGDRPSLLANVPSAEFIANVDDFMRLPENDLAENVLRKLDERHQLYKMMDTSLIQRRLKLMSKIDDLKQSLQLIKAVRNKQVAGESVQTLFLLSDMCYVNATVPPTDRICLWLGANVMVEYSSEEAESFLSKELAACEAKKAEFDTSIEFVKNCLTTTEVNMARIYNWDVQKKKAMRATGVVTVNA